MTESKTEQREKVIRKAVSVTEPLKMGIGKILVLISSPLWSVCVFNSTHVQTSVDKNQAQDQGLGKLIHYCPS